MPRGPKARANLRAVLGAVAFGAIAFAVTAQAQQATRPANKKQPTLHVDVRPPSDPARAADVAKRHIGPDPKAGQNPAAFGSNGKILPEPDADKQPDTNEPVLGRGGFAADRDTSSRPDYHTGPDATLHYVTVFNPSILPFKRMSAMDAVLGDYTLGIAEPDSLYELDVGGNNTPDRDMFWGSVMLQLEPGVDVPLPSVSPDMRILSWELEPTASGQLTFSKDGADNYYVRSDESDVSGEYRLVFLVDADAGYFAPDIPQTYRVRDLEQQAPRGLLQPIPDRIRPTVERALDHLGVNENQRLNVALDTLVRYFRQFQAEPSPASTGDIFWDLFISQAGVCRHRSFAFMVAANGLGIPTRYVTNEAHAWVEVWVPTEEWVRIDLGGAALRMEVSNAKDKSIYRPRGEDQFPKPPEYSDNYTQLEGDIAGLSGDQLAEGRAPIDTDSTDPSMTDPDAPFDPDGDPIPDPDVRVGPGTKLPALPDNVLENKDPTAITVDAVAVAEAYRGESLSVSGNLSTDGAGLASQRVDIYLAPAYSGGNDAVLVGHTVTDDNGDYTADIELPVDLELGEWEIYAATGGNKKYAPAVSD